MSFYLKKKIVICVIVYYSSCGSSSFPRWRHYQEKKAIEKTGDVKINLNTYMMHSKELTKIFWFCIINQAEGKKRMKAIGKVDVPQEAFMAVLRLEKEVI